jgi:DhnA family fructose-bisphosphate aldolase class Ia
MSQVSSSDADGRLTVAPAGKVIRAPYLYVRSRAIVIAPVDDHLISGPFAGLENPRERLVTLAGAGVDAILTFAGLASRNPLVFAQVPSIINLTASTVRSHPARKIVVGSVQSALRLNASAIAVHINCGSSRASVMIEQAGRVLDRAARYDLPAMGIMYPRGEHHGEDDDLIRMTTRDPAAYNEAVAHAVAIGASLGFDIIKTKYTGDCESFTEVVLAANGVPIVVAGEHLVTEPGALKMAAEALSAGAAGVSFGRNFFGRSDPAPLIARIRKLGRGA